MVKIYLLRVILLCSFLTLLFGKASAQYAETGVADARLLRSVYYLTFGSVNTGYTGDGGLGPNGSGSTLISAPSGYLDPSTANGGANDNIGPRIVAGTYVWQFSPTVQITATIGTITFSDPTHTRLRQYTPGGSGSDRFNWLFNPNKPYVQGSAGIPNSGIASPFGAAATFNINIDVTILINGVYVTVPYPGMVIADAETVSSPASGEYFGANTPNSIKFQLLAKLFAPATSYTTQQPYTNADANNYKLILSGGGTQFRIQNLQPTDGSSANGNYGIAAVMYASGAHELDNVTVKGEGITAVAIGFILPFDLGDAPASYGFTGNYIDTFNLQAQYQADGTYSINSTVPQATLTPQANVYIGTPSSDPVNIPVVDADGQQLGNAYASVDDSTYVNDENTFTGTNKPTIRNNQDGDLVFTLPSVSNGKNTAATLYAWVDLNGDGKFTQNEEQQISVPANTSSQSYTFTYPNSGFKNLIKVGATYARFRVTTSNLTSTLSSSDNTNVDPRSQSYAADGETEDYRLDVTGLTISGSVYDDGNGGSDNVISGTAISKAGTAQLYAYLANGSGVLLAKTPVATDGSYQFTNVNNSSNASYGTYTVAISTVNITASLDGTQTLSSVPATLPSGYIPSGASYGVNNGTRPANSVQTGVTPNLQVLVNTSYSSTNVTGVNFGIDQIPVANNDGGYAVGPGNTIVIDAPSNDTDADGTIDKTTLLLIDPSDGVKKTSVNVANVGSYSVNSTTGKVTFTAASNFNAATSITYTINDNFGAISNIATISIGYSPGPSVNNDVATTTIGQPVTTNVTSNDGNPNGTVALPSNTSTKGGTLVLNSDNTVTYTPPSGFTGKDTYTYTLTDNTGTSAPATVTVSVKPVGVADAFTTTVNTANTSNTVTNNDGVSGSNTGTTVTNLTTPTATNSSGATGTVNVNSDGKTVTYTPATGYVGKDTYTYKLTTADGVSSDPVTVTESVRPVAANDSFTTPINTQQNENVKSNDGASGTAPGIIVTLSGTNTLKGGTIALDANGNVNYTPATNFIGKDGYGYTLTTSDGVTSSVAAVVVSVKPVGVNDAYTTPVNTVIQNPVTSNDGASASGTTVTLATSPSNGSVTLNNNVFTYTPNNGYAGTDSYTYTLTTSDNVVSDPITVNITIVAPGAADTDFTPINTPVTTDVRANDGATNSSATVTPSNGTTKGGTVANDGANKVIYTPPTNFTGKDTYTYTLTNGSLVSSPINVTITVKPVGVNDAYSTAVNTPIINDVKTNDGASANGTTVSVVSQPTHGSVAGNNGNSSTYFTYTPTTGYVGTDTYTYALTTADGAVSDPITVTVNIVAAGTTTGNPDADITKINTAKVTNVKANDGSTFTNATVTPSSPTTKGGTVTVDGSNNVIYTPPTNFTGLDTYTYTLTNSGGSPTSPITVSIAVKPIGMRDYYATAVNTAVINSVKDNDGASATGTTVTAVTQPAHGAATLNNNVITYTPATGYVGTDTYTYKLTTADGVSSDPITVVETISTTSTTTGNPDNDVTLINTAKSTNVKANDGSTFTNATVSPTPGSHGSTSVDANGIVTYTPNSGYTGKDSYTYTLTPSGGSTTAPVTVNISVRPVGVNDSYFTSVNTAVANPVTANDGASGSNTGTTVVLVTPPTYGTVTPNGVNTAFTYTPSTGFTGTDTYTYALVTSDGVYSAPITVTISVAPNGTNDTYTTPINTASTENVKSNDGAVYANATVTATSPTTKGGTTVVNSSGVVTYTPQTGFTGKDSYTYTLTNPGGTAGAPINVTVNVKPVGVNDTYATGINTPNTENVQDNDGASANGTTVAVATAPTNGTVTLTNSNKSFIYTPANGYAGTDSYTYTLTTADNVVSDPITVTITISANGSADADVTKLNTPVTTDVRANDGVTNANATVTIATAPTNGTAVNDGANKVIYTPATNFVGKDTYTYTLTNSGGSPSSPVTVTISVKPVGVNDAYSTAVGTPVNNDVKANDGVSANGTTLAVATGPTHGTVAGNNGASSTYFIYTPTAGYVGTDSYTYTLTTADGVASDPITVAINILAPGTTTGNTDNDITKINTAKVTNVKANDGAAFTNAAVTVTGTSTKGGTTSNDGSNNVIYTPPSNFVGLDSYTYTLTNSGSSPTSPITVNVAVKPVGTHDTYATALNTAVSNPVTTNDGASATNTTVTVVTAPVHGTLALSNNVFTYTPATGYIGTDTYTYKLTTTDGVSSDPVTVIETISNPSTTTGTPDADITFINTAKATSVKANDGPTFTNATVNVATQPAHGTTSVDVNGVVTYTPAPGYTGKDTYTYTLTPSGGSPTAPVTVSISVRPVGINDTYYTAVNSPVSNPVTTNDGASATGNTVKLLDPPTYGNVAVNSSNTIFTYTPGSGFAGTDTYTYALVTPDGVYSAPVTVTVITNPNGTADTFTTPINTASTENVKANDGPGYTNATVAIATAPAHGTATVDPSTNIVTYNPTSNYIGKDTYTYTLTNPGSTAGTPVTVTVNIKPVGVNDIFSTSTGQAVANNITANDGASANGTTVTIVSSPTNGTVAATSTPGTYTYTPASGFAGTDRYKYTLTTSDGVVSDSVTVTINVYATPVTDNDNTLVNTPVTTDVRANDGTSNANAIVNLPTATTNKGGTVVNNGDNKVVYTPPANFTGRDSYTYTLTNGSITSSPVTVNVNVKPVGVNDSYSTAAGVAVNNNVKANDGPSANGTTIAVVAQPSHGSVVGNNGISSTYFVYTPTAGYVGTDSYTYALTTTDGIVSNPVTVNLNIVTPGANGSPDADVTTINTAKTTNVKANDGTALANYTVNPIGPTAQNGTVVNDGNGNIIYTPRTGYTGTDSYTYTLTSPSGTTLTPVAVTISVKPVGVNDAYSTSVNTAVSNNVTSNDGASATGATVAVATPPAHGTLTLNNTTNVFTYTPTSGFTGTDIYTYTLTSSNASGSVTSDPVTVVNTVYPNTTTTGSPITTGNPDNDVTTIGVAKVTPVRANDGSTFATAAVTPTAGSHGTTSADGSGNVTYSPAAGYTGKDTYTYTLTPSGGSATTPVPVSIAVKPVGVTDSYFTPVNTPIANNVTVNDGASATNNTIKIVTPPSFGTVAVNSSNTAFTYTPGSGFIGTDTYNYALVTPDGVVSDPVLVTLTVGNNGAPDNYTTIINTASVDTVKANDGSAYANATVAVATAPAHGSTSVNSNGVITYNPTTGYAGKDAYTYTLSQNGTTSSPISVNINVKPAGVNDNYSTLAGVATTNDVTVNDVPTLQSVSKTLSVSTSPLHGTATVSGNNITYTPTAGYSGTDSFQYTITTSDGVASNPVTVNITIYSAGNPDTDNTLINTPVNTDVRANDGSNNANATVTVTSATTTKGGSVVVDGSNKVTYTPATNFIGVDTYTYTLTNGNQTSAPITVTINVKPVGVNDSYSTSQNNVIVNTVKSNDGASANGTTVAVATQPTHGTVTTNGSPSNYFYYTPTTGYTGNDSYTYTLNTSDGVVSAPITVNISILAPSANGNPDNDVTTINTAKTTNVKANDGPALANATVTPSNPTTKGGTTSTDGNGNVIYTPATNFIGVDTYTYTLTSGGSTTSPVTVTFNVKPVGVNDVYSTSVNTAVLNDVKANDGASATGTTVTVVTQPTHGTVVANSTNTAFTYTPATGYVGTDTYTYKLATSDGVSSDPITVTDNISSAGSGGTPTTGTTDNDVTVINTPKQTNVKANDGANFANATVTPTAGTHGTTTVDANGVVTYTPATGYTGKDSYTYTLTNPGSSPTSPVTVNISVKPVGVSDNYFTAVNTASVDSVKNNDGASATNNTVRVITPPTYGTVAANSGNTIFTYTPANNFIGTDTYTYALVTPDGVLSDPINVSVSVSSNGNPDTYTTPVNTASTQNVKSNDGAAYSGATVTIVTQPSHGTASVGSNGVVTYTPTTGYAGRDAYTYSLTQSGTTSSPISVNISVTPLAVNDTYATTVGTAIVYAVKSNDSGTAARTINTVTNPSNGTISTDGSGNTTYTPSAGFAGTDSYTYSLTTADGVVSNIATVTITISANGMPDADITTVNTPVTTNVKANDGNAYANATVTPTNGSHGTTAVTSTNSVTYTPATGYIGKDTYTYTLTNPGGTAGSPITVTISVKPVGINDTYTTPVNTQVANSVKDNDGASAIGTTVAVVTQPSHGTVVAANSNTSFNYTPATNYVGTDTYTYSLTTSDGVVSDPITVTINIAATGVADNDVTTIGTPKTTDVRANDGPAYTNATVTPQSPTTKGGTTTVDNNGRVVYTPPAGFTGIDTYTYTLTNPGSSPTTPVTVTIRVKPVGVADTYATSVNVPVANSVKDNDGASATGTTVAVSTNPSHGTVTPNSNNTSFTYTPASGYTGSDVYTYTLTTADGVVSDPILVTVNITASSMTLTKIANNGASAVGDVILYTLTVTNTSSQTLSNVKVADAGADAGSISPANVATLSANSSITFTAKHTVTAADVTAGSYSNQASATATDVNGNTVSKPKSDNPATATPDDPTVVQILPKGVITLVKTGVSDYTSVTFTFTITNTGPLTLNNISLTDALLNITNGPVTVAGGLAPGKSTTVTFKYTLLQADRDAAQVLNSASVRATDTNNNTVTNSSTVTVAVPPSPKTSPDPVATQVGQSITFNPTKNDQTSGAAFVAIEITQQPAHGKLVINPDLTITYTPDPGYNGPDVFYYRLRDVNGFYTNASAVAISDGFVNNLRIPNTFTPNGDGINDAFEITGIDAYPNNELIIVNRWGNEVYHKTNYTKEWTGEGLNEGTYYFLLHLKNTDGSDLEVIKGYVTLIRNKVN